MGEEDHIFPKTGSRIFFAAALDLSPEHLPINRNDLPDASSRAICSAAALAGHRADHVGKKRKEYFFRGNQLKPRSLCNWRNPALEEHVGEISSVDRGRGVSADVGAREPCRCEAGNGSIGSSG